MHTSDLPIPEGATIKKTRRLFILGAGCSYAAGLPDGDRLASHLFGYVGGSPWEITFNKPPGAYWAPLKGALFNVMRELADGGPQSRWALDRIFDRFHQLVTIAPGDFGEIYGLLFEATAQLLYARSCHGGATDVYRNFVDGLEPADVILTFNWDTCLEIALHSAGRQFYRALGGDIPKDMPWLLKLHGSIDYLIVNVSCKLKSGERAEFLEVLGAAAPSPFVGSRFELTRLRTHDLGYEVKLNEVTERDREIAAMNGAVLGGYDVGPLLLVHALEEYPSFHILTPGSPPLLYDWQYNLTSQLLARVCPEIAEIIVVGYSFPVYDKPVHQILRKIHRLAGKPPVHIVNPAAASLTPTVLKWIFGKFKLHACGFGDYKWG